MCPMLQDFPLVCLTLTIKISYLQLIGLWFYCVIRYATIGSWQLWSFYCWKINLEMVPYAFCAFLGIQGMFFADLLKKLLVKLIPGPSSKQRCTAETNDSKREDQESKNSWMNVLLKRNLQFEEKMWRRWIGTILCGRTNRSFQKTVRSLLKLLPKEFVCSHSWSFRGFASVLGFLSNWPKLAIAAELTCVLYAVYDGNGRQKMIWKSLSVRFEDFSSC